MVCLIISLIFFLLPTDQLLDYFHSESFREEQKSYR